MTPKGGGSGDAKPSRSLTLIGIVLVAVTIAIAGLTIWNLRRDAIARAVRDANTLGILIAEQNEQLIQTADLVLQETAQMVAAAGVRAPEQFAALMADQKIHQFLAARLRNLPQADALSLIDSNGKVVNYSRGWPARPIDTRSREYFQALRDNDKAGPFVGLPFRNSTNGAWDIPIEQRIDGPGGEFLGIVNLMVEAQYFENLYRRLATSPDESIALFRRDGTMLARYPHLDKMMGGKLPAGARWYDLPPAGGTFRKRAVLDGVARIISTHPLHNFPLVLVVTTAESVQLADWRRQSLLIAIGAVSSAAGLLVFLWIIRAQFGRVALSAAALRQSEARFRDFATTSSDWFWETDADHRFTYLSENIEALGAHPADYIGTRRVDNSADTDQDPAKWREHLAVLARHEPFDDFIYSRKAASGELRTACVSGVPLFGPEGEFLGYRGTARDITREVAAAADLRRAKEAAEAANLAKSQFLANISHELRTPLNAIIGFTELVDTGLAGALQPKQQEFNALVLQSARHLLRIINDILDLAQADAGNFRLREERGVDVAGLIRSCIASMKQQSDAKGLTVSLRIDGPLPPATLDPGRWRQIMLNLLSNAISFTDRGGSITVAAGFAADGDLAIEVHDTGAGMTPAEIAIALEPFGQVDARLVRQHEGAGLGLPLARRLAELHGGSLSVSSAKGHGTTVVVRIPAARLNVPETRPPDEALASAAASAVTGNA